MMKSIFNRLDWFARDESGVVLVEFVVYISLMLGAWINLFAYWDAYRQINASQKAAYSIADMITREQTSVDNTYRDGLRKVFGYMVDVNPNAIDMRITSILYSMDNATTGSFKVHWSYSPGNSMPKLTNTTLKAFTDRIPQMAAGDYVLMIETSMPYTTPVKYTPVGWYLIPTDKISDLIVMRPRFMRVCQSGQICS